MMKKVKIFVEKHPYWAVILFGVIASLFWIALEFFFNNDFQPNGVYGLLFYYVISLSCVRYKQKKK